MRTPGSTSPSAIPRRAAHCVQSVTVPAASTAASRSGSGAAWGSSNSAARPGSANQADSPVSHNDTGTLAATAVAATVNAWEHRSGASVPAVTLTTRGRATGPAYGRCAPGSPTGRGYSGDVLETAYALVLVAVALAIAGGAGYVVLRLYRGQD